MIPDFAGKTIHKEHNLSAPQGVRGRYSDNTKLREVLGWEPQISLEEGLRRTYQWIFSQLESQPEKYDVKYPKSRSDAEVSIGSGEDRLPTSDAPRPHGDKLDELVPRGRAGETLAVATPA